MAWRESLRTSLTELSRQALIERVLEQQAQLAEAQEELAGLRRHLSGAQEEHVPRDGQAQ